MIIIIFKALIKFIKYLFQIIIDFLKARNYLIKFTNNLKDVYQRVFIKKAIIIVNIIITKLPVIINFV